MFSRCLTLLAISVILISFSCRGGGDVPANQQPSLSIRMTTGEAQILTMLVHDADGDDVTVTANVPAGFAVDKRTQVVTGGNGEIKFFWDRLNEAISPEINTVITASDGQHVDSVSKAVRVTWPIANRGPGPGIFSPFYADLGDGSAQLRLHITGHRDEPWTVGVTTPPDFTADSPTQTLAPWQDACTFNLSCDTPAVGGSGTVTISLLNGAQVLDEETTEVGIEPAGANTAPQITAIEWVDTAQGQGVLRVTASDADGEDLWLQVTGQPGFYASEDIGNIASGAGQAEFTYYAHNKQGGARGAVDIAVLDTRHGAAFATQEIVIPPGVYAPPEITDTHWLDLGDGTGWLYIDVLEPAYLRFTLSIDPLPGFTMQPLNVSGTKYLFTADDKTAAASGNARITVSSSSGTVMQTVPVTLAPAAT